LKTLEEIRTMLVGQLKDEGKLSLVNARLILRTGVNLSALRPGQAADPVLLKRVIVALQDMGFKLDEPGKGR
jgi:hypothetical protein